MTMTSYAQNREDVLLRRLFPAPDGFYVDIGAAHPVSHSVTKFFYELGWSGVNVEPQRDFYADLVADRPRDTNLNTLVSDAVSEKTFYEIPSNQGCGSLESGVAEAARAEGREVVERHLLVTTLDEILRRHAADRTIDFLKIDVEGHERAALSGLDLDVWRPRAIVVEATVPGSAEPNFGSWENLIVDRGYAFACFDGLNRYYIRDEDADLLPRLATPTNVFDDYITHDVVFAREEAASYSAWGERCHLECERLAATTVPLEVHRDLQQERERLQQERDRLLQVREALQSEQERLLATTVPLEAHDALLAILQVTRNHLDDVRHALISGGSPA